MLPAPSCVSLIPTYQAVENACMGTHTQRHTSGAQRISPLSLEGLVSPEKLSSNLTSRTQCIRKPLPSESFGVQHNAKTTLTGEMVAPGVVLCFVTM